MGQRSSWAQWPGGRGPRHAGLDAGSIDAQLNEVAGGDLGGDVLGHRLVVREGAGEGAGAVGGGAQVDGVADQLGLRDLGLDQRAVVADLVGAQHPGPPGRRGRS